MQQKNLPFLERGIPYPASMTQSAPPPSQISPTPNPPQGTTNIAQPTQRPHLRQRRDLFQTSGSVDSHNLPGTSCSREGGMESKEEPVGSRGARGLPAKMSRIDNPEDVDERKVDAFNTARDEYVR